MRKFLSHLGLAALALCLAKPAAAETIGYADAMDMLMAACGNDVQAHCKDVRIGSGRIEACLQQSGVSPQCTATSAQVAVLLEARAAGAGRGSKALQARRRRSFAPTSGPAMRGS